MSTSSSGTPEWGELAHEEVQLPSGHTITVSELSAEELMSLPEGKESGMHAVSLAIGFDSNIVKKMGSRDFLFLARIVNRMNGIGDEDVPLASENGTE